RWVGRAHGNRADDPARGRAGGGGAPPPWRRPDPPGVGIAASPPGRTAVRAGGLRGPPRADRPDDRQRRPEGAARAAPRDPQRAGGPPPLPVAGPRVAKEGPWTW